MRRILVVYLLLSSSPLFASDAPPLAQAFLHSGQLARGEQTLAKVLAEKPDDDQARFGLAVVQLVQGIERLGQSLHFYGVKPSNDLFLRLPVPENPDPAPINAYRFRRMLDDFRRDLLVVEATLAGIKDDEVQLPLKLAEITLDFDADGEPTDKFRDVLLKLFNNRRFQFMEGNPEFLVVFDRGDVAWLRAYCHLMAGIIDLVLAVDTEDRFDLWADRAFSRPQIKFEGTDEERLKKTIDQRDLVLIEPTRWGRFRKHLVAVTDLNDETWKHIRLETDDDHEWLPNSRQKGVLGLPVQDVQIDAWLVAMREFKRLLEGERTFPNFWDNKPDGLELDLRLLLDDPPERLIGDGAFPRNLGEKYLVERRQLKVEVFFPVLGMFLNPATMGYPIWFN